MFKSGTVLLKVARLVALSIYRLSATTRRIFLVILLSSLLSSICRLVILNIGDKREDGIASMERDRNWKGEDKEEEGEVVRVRWRDRRRPSFEIPARRSLLSDKLLIPKSWPSSPLNPDKERYLAPEGQKKEHRPGSKSGKTPSLFLSFSLPQSASACSPPRLTLFFFIHPVLVRNSRLSFFRISRGNVSRWCIAFIRRNLSSLRANLTSADSYVHAFLPFSACIHGVPKKFDKSLMQRCRLSQSCIVWFRAPYKRESKCLIKILFSWLRYHQAHETRHRVSRGLLYTTYYRFFNLIAGRYIREPRVAACLRIVSFPRLVLEGVLRECLEWIGGRVRARATYHVRLY